MKNDILKVNAADAKVVFAKTMSRGNQLAMPLLANDGKSLVRLNLIDQPITEIKMQALINAAQFMNTLQILVLQNTNISDLFMAKLLGNVGKSAKFFRSLTYRGHN